MAKIIQVTPELLESTAGKIEGLAGDYKTQYDQLYSETNVTIALALNPNVGYFGDPIIDGEIKAKFEIDAEARFFSHDENRNPDMCMLPNIRRMNGVKAVI